MLRLLIADRDGILGEEVRKQLSGEYDVQLCNDGNRLLELVADFDPDILVTELRLPGVDGLNAIQMLRSSGRTTAIIVISDHWNESVLASLDRLQVSGIFTLPCAVHTITTAVREAGFRICYPEKGDWCMELEADRLLLSLGFHMGRSRYFCVYEAICAKCADFDRAITKEVYPDVVAHMGGNVKQVEKAIRDTIRAAFAAGDQRVWRLYFEPGADGQLHCPTNDAFITRIARALLQRTRYKLPYQPAMEQAL